LCLIWPNNWYYFDPAKPPLLEVFM
jgi:hypothetical protein